MLKQVLTNEKRDERKMYTILTEFIPFDENMETIDYEQSREVSLQALRRVNNIFALRTRALSLT